MRFSENGRLKSDDRKKFNRCVYAFTERIVSFVQLKNVGDVQSAGRHSLGGSFAQVYGRHAARCATGARKGYLFTIAYRLIIDGSRRLQTLLGRGGWGSSRYGSGRRLQKRSGPDARPGVRGAQGEWRSMIMLRDWEGYTPYEGRSRK